MTEHLIAPPGAVTEVDELRSASRLRRQPYALLFPLGIALSWAGIAHWLAYSMGWLAAYRPRFHATVQMQGFLTALALGFLFTMIPRRTGTAPPATWQIAVAAAGPVLVSACAWESNWVLAQSIWILTALTGAVFVVRRFLTATARRRPPNGFVWIPCAFAMGIGGAAAIWATAEELAGPLARQFGEGLVQQGMFVGLVLGVGSLALPLMTRGEGPPDGSADRSDRLARLGHLTGAMLLAGSLWLEVTYSLRFAMFLRGGVVLAVLLSSAEIWRPPRRPGWNARLILLSAWMLPLGYLLAGLFPLAFRAGLHVALIGGLALLGLAVSAQVILGHGGYREVLFGRPVPLLVMLLAIAGAVVARALMEVDSVGAVGWMGWAAGLFLVATLAWLRLVAPGLLAPRS